MRIAYDCFGVLYAKLLQKDLHSFLCADATMLSSIQ